MIVKKKQTYLYTSQEVTYNNTKADISLAGTLTLPSKQGIFPTVILIAGYGPKDRDATGMGHKYFLTLADYLTQQGIGILRFDKRGVGQSTGSFETSTSRDFADDVIASINYLKSRSDIDAHKIGLIGISEGGLIASMAAAESLDVAFMVLMAPAVITNVEDLVEMTARQLRADGASYNFIENDQKLRTDLYSIIKQKTTPEAAEERLKAVVAEYLSNLPESQKLEAEKLPFAFTAEKADALIKTFNSPWYRFFLNYRTYA
jgi:alpha/beta superfamily hydrolase